MRELKGLGSAPANNRRLTMQQVRRLTFFRNLLLLQAGNATDFNNYMKTFRRRLQEQSQMINGDRIIWNRASLKDKAGMFINWNDFNGCLNDAELQRFEVLLKNKQANKLKHLRDNASSYGRYIETKKNDAIAWAGRNTQTSPQEFTAMANAKGAEFIQRLSNALNNDPEQIFPRLNKWKDRCAKLTDTLNSKSTLKGVAHFRTLEICRSLTEQINNFQSIKNSSV